MPVGEDVMMSLRMHVCNLMSCLLEICNYIHPGVILHFQGSHSGQGKKWVSYILRGFLS